MPAAPELLRVMGRWTLTALVINSTIGVGIFKLPSDVSARLGDAAPWGYLIAAAGISVLVAVFAEMSSQFTESGGQYVYAHTALGKFAGIQTGWFFWLTRLTAMSAIINVLLDYLGEWWPGMSRVARIGVIFVLVAGLAVLNYRGIKFGALFSNAVTVAKLTTLGLFIVGGLVLLTPVHSPLAATTSVAPRTLATWGDALVVLMYAFGGFENGITAAGEANNPRRDAPFALYAGLVVVTLCYVLAHVVCMRALPELAHSKLPIADAARTFAGDAGAKAVAIGVMLSAIGTVSAAFVTAPRLTYALAQRREFPALLGAVHPRFRTPHVSIVVWAVCVFSLAVMGGFLWNAILSVAARLITYVVTCAALIAMRRRFPDADAWRAPGGRMLALIGIAYCLVLGRGFTTQHFVVVGVIAAIATVNWLVVRRHSVK